MTSDTEWRSEAPTETGDFFYTGPTPDGTEIVAIVQVFANPHDGSKEACVLIPPNWRGTGCKATVHSGKLDEWKGQWSGPEYGLCCAESRTDTDSQVKNE